MAHYIDKDALVAEIEKIKCKVDDGSSYCNGWQHALRKLEIEINTLEVKEADLEKEFNNLLDDVEGVPRMWHSNEQIEWGKDIAKHFFELGLNLNQRGE